MSDLINKNRPIYLKVIYKFVKDKKASFRINPYYFAAYFKNSPLIVMFRLEVQVAHDDIIHCCVVLSFYFKTI